MKKIITFGTFLLFFLNSAAYSQSCNCSRIITQSGIYNGATMNVQPGEVICIQSGEYSLLRFVDFVGTEDQPIIFKNCGGRVTISHNQYYGALDFLGSKHFKVTGTGSPDFQYGIFISGTGQNASGLSVAGLSSNCEIDHLEIQNTGFAGMLIKTDPNCNPNSWRANFAMRKVSIHHNYIHNTGGEGMYVGSSFFNGKSITCEGQTITVFPHLIEGLKIYDNITENTGADGIQYSCSPQAEVYNNVVNSYGISPFEVYQNNGIQAGASGGKCFGNKITNGSGNGIIITQPTDNMSVYNNLVINSGKNSLFGDDRTTSNINFLIANNTFVKSGQENIKLYGNLSTKNIFNNILVEPINNTNYITYAIGAQGNEQSNLKIPTIAEALFRSPTDFHTTINSPAINAGYDISSLNIVDDIEGNLRSNGGKYDIGAYESLVNPPVLDALSNKVLSSGSSLSFNISAIDPDGEIPALGVENRPTFVSLTDNGNGTATFSAIPQSQNQTFDLTFVATDQTGGRSSKTIQITLYASVPNSTQSLFRINAGGTELSTAKGDFTIDTSNNPSPFSNVAEAGSLGGTSIISTNQTDLPNQVFQTFRRDSQSGDDMRWSFPVFYDPSWYKVNLYFNETVSSANRQFNIIIEGNNVAPNFNIKAEAGVKNALKKSFNVYVSDANLNLQLQRILDNPLISAIEIISLGVNNPGGRLNYSNESPIEEIPLEMNVYPNPAKDFLHINQIKLENKTGINQLQLVNNHGQSVWKTNLSNSDTELQIPIHQLSAGLYEVVLNNSGKIWTKKFVKN